MLPIAERFPCNLIVSLRGNVSTFMKNKIDG